MVLIYGSNNIEREFERRLRAEKGRLLRDVTGHEARFLFVTVQAMNYHFGPRLTRKEGESFSYLDMPVFRIMVCLRSILDTLLEEGYNQIEGVNPQRFLEIFESLKDYFSIAKYSHLLNIQRASRLEKVRINGEMVDDFAGEAYHKAMQRYADDAGSDQGWSIWYFANYPEHRIRVGRLLGTEFKRAFGLEIADAGGISGYLERLARQHLDQVSKGGPVGDYPFLSIRRELLLEEFRSHTTHEAAIKWIQELEYRPNRDFNRSPLIPLVANSRPIYTLALWVLYPSHTFFGAWLKEMFNLIQGSKAFGDWSRGYGELFEKYLDHLLGSSGLRLEVKRNLKVSVRDYPEIIPIISRAGKKEGFELDRLMIKDDTAYVVSCKARDFLYDQKLTGRDFFFPSKEIERRVTQNLVDMEEVKAEVECIESSPRLKSSLELNGKELVPIVVTSRKEPLSFYEVRGYYKSLTHVPNVRIVNASTFIESLKTR
ncbi:MAG: hypothetical protein HY619_04050 [Thaumarchaeota archaeon]|nr:hypothetical protein [Nitrososphaerota archaeon]